MITTGLRAARFWMKVRVAPADTCWEWLARIDRNGYGSFRIGKMLGAHRIAYELSIGEIPEGLELDHLCRNRACVNPAHLEPVTKYENWARGQSPTALHAAKTHCPQGHPYDEENTYTTYRGFRQCRPCNRDAVARYKRRQSEVIS